MPLQPYIIIHTSPTGTRRTHLAPPPPRPEMMTGLSLYLFWFVIVMASRICPAVTLRRLPSDPCDPTSQPVPKTLRSDQFTVLINGYSESRITLLQSIATVYSSSPLVSAVVVLWGNPSTPTLTLTQLSHNLSIRSTGDAPISVLRQPSASLNNRFLPRSWIKTRAVLICDDDVEIDSKSIEFAFTVWNSNRDRLVGFFARSHDFDLSDRAWIYTVHPDKYSIMLTKFMMMKMEYLYSYTCQGGESMADARRVVDEMRNCEDILMNFVAAESGGPVLVGAKRVRDWGDPRNEEGRRHGRGRGLAVEEGKTVREVGLSSRKGDHRKRRGVCIKEFHKRLGKMPLKYSYGKVVNSVGEQGLCNKHGKLVFCDQQVSN